MEYISRSTPHTLCQRGLKKFDLAIRSGFEYIVGFGCTEAQWRQAILPSRYSGLGFRSATFYADAAYIPSMAATHEAMLKLNTGLGPDGQVVMGADLQSIPSQNTLSDKIAKKTFDTMTSIAEPFDMARMKAYAAPGVNRWLDDPPSRTLDRHLSSAELTTAVKLTLGVDVADGKSLCRFCAAVLDTKGIHPCSCTAGGDVTWRHNQGRDKLFRWAMRGHLNPELEKAGILNEPAVMITSLRRPADVLVDNPANRMDKVALDVKVINALGPDHLAETM